jgi:septum formation inhibitor-activating ATPase MinD
MMVMMLLDNTSRVLRMKFLKKTIETLKCSIPFFPEISDLMNSDRLLFVIKLHSKKTEEGEAQARVVHHHRLAWSSQPSDGGV